MEVEKGRSGSIADCNGHLPIEHASLLRLSTRRGGQVEIEKRGGWGGGHLLLAMATYITRLEYASLFAGSTRRGCVPKTGDLCHVDED